MHGTCRIDAIRSNEQELCTLSQGIPARLQSYNISACCTEIIVLYHAPCPSYSLYCCGEDQAFKYLGLYSMSPGEQVVSSLCKSCTDARPVFNKIEDARDDEAYCPLVRLLLDARSQSNA